MSKINRNTRGTGESVRTFEGAPAVRFSKEKELRRAVLACMLWEDSFYESGVDIADRISGLVTSVAPDKVAQLAKEARGAYKLRHAPLLLTREMARSDKHRHLVADTLADIIQRPDELTEFLSIYWKNGRQPLANQVKKGLARAFPKFDEYQLAKYNRQEEIKLRDVLFMTHPKPENKAQEELWKKLVEGTLATPDTWEVGLSAGGDKKETFERLMAEKKLGAMAFLRNLRGMIQAGVSKTTLKNYMKEMNVSRVLPFRFITAAKHAPTMESDLEKSMFKCLETRPKLEGKTILLVDVSGSMDYDRVSGKSELTRMDAACALGMILREMCDDIDVFTFSERVIEIPARRGFALRDAIISSQRHSGTYLGRALETINKNDYDRLIVITDEQSHDTVGKPKGTGYMLNVASYQNGVGYGHWNRIDGWSEAVIDYIPEFEKL